MLSLQVSIPSKTLTLPLRVRNQGWVTVRELKEQLSSIPEVDLSSTMFVLHRGRVLTDEMLLHDHGVRDGCGLELIGTLNVFLAVPTPWNAGPGDKVTTRTLCLEIEPTCTAEQLKSIIHHVERIPTRMQRFSFQGRRIGIEQIELTAYGIKDGSELTLEVGRPMSIALDSVLNVFVPFTYTEWDVLHLVSEGLVQGRGHLSPQEVTILEQATAELHIPLEHRQEPYKMVLAFPYY